MKEDFNQHKWVNFIAESRLVSLRAVVTTKHVKVGHYWPTIEIPFKIEPVHEISNNVVCATSKASDQPAHTRSLIRAFASHLSIL